MTVSPTGTGDCFLVAAKLVLDDPAFADARVCHGWASRPGDGLRHTHAWVEVTQDVQHPDWPRPVTLTVCVDRSNGHAVSMPDTLYYKLGNIDSDRVLRYTADEVLDWCSHTRQWGPWEDDRLDAMEVTV